MRESFDRYGMCAISKGEKKMLLPRNFCKKTFNLAIIDTNGEGNRITTHLAILNVVLRFL